MGVLPASDDSRVALIASKIQSFPDFPKPGVNFKDIFSVFRDPEALAALLDLLKEVGGKLKGEIDAVVGLDARGFLIGPVIAAEMGVPFVPVRKAGKLPGACYGTSYTLEYGSANLELQKDALAEDSRVLVVDDLLATGGTLAAAFDLVAKAGARPVRALLMIELAFLEGRKKLAEGVDVEAMIKY